MGQMNRLIQAAGVADDYMSARQKERDTCLRVKNEQSRSQNLAVLLD